MKMTISCIYKIFSNLQFKTQGPIKNLRTFCYIFLLFTCVPLDECAFSGDGDLGSLTAGLGTVLEGMKTVLTFTVMDA